MSPARALLPILDRFERIRVAVVGDLMLDHYLEGRATRISQEAPVPIVHRTTDRFVPGGAANVAANVAGLGATACVFGIVGADGEAARLLELLDTWGADVTDVLTCPERPTTLKTRVIANQQQVLRIDREQTDPVSCERREQLGDLVCARIRAGAVDAVLFEDYAKGVLSPELIVRIVKEARAAGIPATLDPHPGNAFRVPGLTLMTPNRAEAFGLAGVYYQPTILPLHRDRPLSAVARQLLHEWQMEALLVTMGGDGMALFTRTGGTAADPEELPTAEHIPTRAREVFDVSGAGDTVMASCVLALAAGATPSQAADLANHAAGVVVGQLGTVAVRRNELVQALNEPDPRAATGDCQGN